VLHEYGVPGFDPDGYRRDEVNGGTLRL